MPSSLAGRSSTVFHCYRSAGIVKTTGLTLRTLTNPQRGKIDLHLLRLRKTQVFKPECCKCTGRKTNLPFRVGASFDLRASERLKPAAKQRSADLRSPKLNGSFEAFSCQETKKMAAF